MTDELMSVYVGVHVHLNISLSESASLIFGNQISIRCKWMTKTSQTRAK